MRAIKNNGTYLEEQTLILGGFHPTASSLVPPGTSAPICCACCCYSSSSWLAQDWGWGNGPCSHHILRCKYSSHCAYKGYQEEDTYNSTLQESTTLLLTLMDQLMMTTCSLIEGPLARSPLIASSRLTLIHHRRQRYDLHCSRRERWLEISLRDQEKSPPYFMWCQPKLTHSSFSPSLGKAGWSSPSRSCHQSEPPFEASSCS